MVSRHGVPWAGSSVDLSIWAIRSWKRTLRWHLWGYNLRLIMTCESNSQSSWKSYQAVLETNISAAHKGHYILSWCASSNPNISLSTSWIQVCKLVHVNIRTRWISIVVFSFSRCQIRSIYSDCSDGNCHCSWEVTPWSRIIDVPVVTTPGLNYNLLTVFEMEPALLNLSRANQILVGNNAYI